MVSVVVEVEVAAAVVVVAVVLAVVPHFLEPSLNLHRE